MPTSREDALKLAKRFGDATSGRDVAAIMDLYSEDAVAVSPLFGTVKGRGAIAETWRTLFSLFPDMAVAVSNVLVDGDRIALIASVTATDRAGWFGLPPTGERIDYRLVLLLTVAQGQFVLDERLYDNTGVLERLEKARLDKELRTAAEVQRALLARSELTSRFCHSAGSAMPCRSIGGDFFEFIELPSGEIGVAMGDVAGKGPAAALLAAMLQGMLAVDAPGCAGPADLLSRLNQRLAVRSLGSRFVTFVYAVLSSDGRLVYANAGHNPPMLMTRSGIHRLEAGGPVLGVFADAKYEEQTLHVSHGDSLTMFTDGVTEARNPIDEEFGDERLAACLRTASTLAPGEMLPAIFGAVRSFCRDADQSDDITVTVTRFVGSTSRA